MKKIISLAAIAIVAVAAAVGVSKNANEVELSDLALANVEALARGEGNHEDCATYCSKDERYTCFILYPGSDGITCSEHRKKQN